MDAEYFASDGNKISAAPAMRLFLDQRNNGIKSKLNISSCLTSVCSTCNNSSGPYRYRNNVADKIADLDLTTAILLSIR